MTKPIAQIGFIKYVLLPLFEALSKVCPISNSKINIHNLNVPKLYPEVEKILTEHLHRALSHYEKKKDFDEKKKKLLEPEPELESLSH